LIDAVVSPKMKVKNVHYVNMKKLTGELEVDADAEVWRYNVRVSTRSGPKGIGTELFRVVEKNRPSGEFTVTDFTVQQVDRTETPDASVRCPDPAQPCNKLILEYTGEVDALSFQVGIDWEGLYDDVSVEGAFRAALPALSGATGTLYPTDPNTVITYWQGQWRPIVNWECVYPENECDEWGDTEFLIDRGPDDAYVFRIGFRVGDRSYSGALPRKENAHAHFRGTTPPQAAYPVIDDAAVVVTRGSKKTPGATALIFETQAFSDSVVNDGSTTLVAYHNVLVTSPEGHRSIPPGRSVGFGHSNEPEIWKETYYIPDVVEGCYSVRVIGVVTDTFEGHNEDRFAAWDSSVRYEMGLRVLGQSVSVVEGGCGS
jgi:hypothetical protein